MSHERSRNSKYPKHATMTYSRYAIPIVACTAIVGDGIGCGDWVRNWRSRLGGLVEPVSGGVPQIVLGRHHIEMAQEGTRYSWEGE